MKDSLTTYKIWAPDDARWTQWAKPVLFTKRPNPSNQPLDIPQVRWASYPDNRTAYIIDMPGDTGVLEGISLAGLGYRPVPLYNGVYSPNRKSMVVDVTLIVSALFRCAEQLATAPIRPTAPPVFLLDSNRMSSYRSSGKYDNRWCVFPQDMPSASTLLSHGITKVVLRAGEIQNDLSHILCRYQKGGLLIQLVDDEGRLREAPLIRPSNFKSWSYRFKTMAGLTRNAAGGFGGTVPEPTQSSGYRHYGIG